MKNYSKQREEIIEIIKQLRTHPTAEEIYFLTKQKDPAVSRSTVYRNLAMFVQKGMVTQIAVSNAPDQYDYIHNREKHGHAICKECGKLYDFRYDFEFEKIKTSIAKQTGLDLSEGEMIVRGVCSSCKKAQN